MYLHSIITHILDSNCHQMREGSFPTGISELYNVAANANTSYCGCFMFKSLNWQNMGGFYCEAITGNKTHLSTRLLKMLNKTSIVLTVDQFKL